MFGRSCGQTDHKSLGGTPPLAVGDATGAILARYSVTNVNAEGVSGARVVMRARRPSVVNDASGCLAGDGFSSRQESKRSRPSRGGASKVEHALKRLRVSHPPLPRLNDTHQSQLARASFDRL